MNNEGNGIRITRERFAVMATLHKAQGRCNSCLEMRDQFRGLTCLDRMMKLMLED
jgi:hypothetical protein